MSKERQENLGWLIILAGALIVLPALYVLAIGPSHWLMDHGHPRWILGLAVIFMATTAVVGLLEERRGRAPSPR